MKFIPPLPIVLYPYRRLLSLLFVSYSIFNEPLTFYPG
nr:MAG TPA: hypothetical protein [Caudoviricetes sp.]